MMSKAENFIIINNELQKYVGDDENVVIPEGVTKIGKRAFECSQLKTVELPKSLKIIDELAFNVISLEKVVFHEGLTTIKRQAFCCSKLVEIEIPKSVKNIAKGAFDCNILLTIYCKVKEKPSGWHDNWNQYHWDGSCSPVVWDCDNNKIAEDGFRYVFVDGAKYSLKDGKATLLKFETRDMVSVEIPSQIIFEDKVYLVTTLGNDLFSHYEKLQEVKIPDSVIELGKGVFSSCDVLEKVKLPDNITKIPNATFNCSKKLKEVYLGNEITSIGDFAFAGCNDLHKVTLPKNLKYIGEKAFFSCSNLTEIIIPDGVETIEKNAFAFSSRLVIYCALPTRPSGWSKDLDYCRIIWNFNKNKKELLEELSSLCTEEQLKEFVEYVKKGK